MEKGMSKENFSLCFQCAKCSAGCPVADEMDVLPHMAMHYLCLGMEERVLSSRTMWMCASCYTCAVRCPNDINVTAVMDNLRQKSVEKGVPCPKPDVLTFHRNFMNDFMRRGRVHEIRMMGEYNLKRGKPFDNLIFGMKMFLKNRLSLIPPKKVKGFKEWAGRIWKTQK